jgi:hypothetical protein
MGDCIPIHRRRAMCFMTCVRAERPEDSTSEELLSRQAARRSRIERPTVFRVPTSFRMTMHSVGRRRHSSSRGALEGFSRGFPLCKAFREHPWGLLRSSCDHRAECRNGSCAVPACGSKARRSNRLFRSELPPSRGESARVSGRCVVTRERSSVRAQRGAIEPASAATAEAYYERFIRQPPSGKFDGFPENTRWSPVDTYTDCRSLTERAPIVTIPIGCAAGGSKVMRGENRPLKKPTPRMAGSRW